jgi:hypothetical protein
MKTCFKCKENKSLEDFGMSNKSKDKLKSWCKECCATYSKLNYTNTYWHGLSLAKYKLSSEEYERMLDEQKSLCAICKQPDTVKLCVDHCHRTNKIRKLLCRSCNYGLGCFKDNPELCINAAKYLNDQTS